MSTYECKMITMSLKFLRSEKKDFDNALRDGAIKKCLHLKKSLQEQIKGYMKEFWFGDDSVLILGVEKGMTEALVRYGREKIEIKTEFTPEELLELAPIEPLYYELVNEKRMNGAGFDLPWGYSLENREECLDEIKNLLEDVEKYILAIETGDDNLYKIKVAKLNYETFVQLRTMLIKFLYSESIARPKKNKPRNVTPQL